MAGKAHVLPTMCKAPYYVQGSLLCTAAQGGPCGRVTKDGLGVLKDSWIYKSLKSSQKSTEQRKATSCWTRAPGGGGVGGPWELVSESPETCVPRNPVGTQ